MKYKIEYGYDSEKDATVFRLNGDDSKTITIYNYDEEQVLGMTKWVEEFEAKFETARAAGKVKRTIPPPRTLLDRYTHSYTFDTMEAWDELVALTA